LKALFTLFFIFFLLSFKVFAAKDFGCIDGKIRFNDGKIEKVVTESYCYDSILRKIYSIGRCKPNAKCMADTEQVIVLKKSEILADPKVAPGFKICEKFQGQAQVIEFWDGSKWFKAARCLFGDASYIDILTLAKKVKFSDASAKK